MSARRRGRRNRRRRRAGASPRGSRRGPIGRSRSPSSASMTSGRPEPLALVRSPMTRYEASWSNVVVRRRGDATPGSSSGPSTGGTARVAFLPRPFPSLSKRAQPLDAAAGARASSRSIRRRGPHRTRPRTAGAPSRARPGLSGKCAPFAPEHREARRSACTRPARWRAWTRCRRCSLISVGPVAQLRPIASTPSGSIAVSAAPISDPMSMVPVVSTVTWTKIGSRMPGSRSPVDSR